MVMGKVSDRATVSVMVMVMVKVRVRVRVSVMVKNNSAPVFLVDLVRNQCILP